VRAAGKHLWAPGAGGRLVLLLAVLLGAALAGCGSNTGPGKSAEEKVTPEFRYAFDAERAFAYLEKQVSFGPRNPGSEGHRRCLEWMKQEAAKTADRVFTQSFTRRYGGKDITFTNVFAVYPGASDRIVILCAHWDTRPFADEETDPARAAKPIPGANDGASGVAALLELGHLFRAQKPPVTVVVIFFDGEDFGKDVKDMLLGSTEFARQWRAVLKDVGQDVEYGILLDMVGAKDLRIPREVNSQQAAPWLMDAIYRHAREAGLEKVFPDEPGPQILDDHIPLIRAGIPTVDLISFDYAYWHTLDDTPDKCSPESLKAVGEVVARTVYSDIRRPR